MPPSLTLIRQLACLVLGMSAAAPSATGGTLYATDFEAFTPGDNQWAGTEGWLSNDTTSGAQGILEDHVENLPLGKTAYLGFEPPAAAFTTVYRAVNYDPATGLIPVVEFESFLGVQDSTNGKRDRFYVSFYNISGDFLAALCLDNTNPNDGYMWREDGVGRINTGVPFIRGNQLIGFVALQILRARIDLVQNQWSAWLDGIPLFTDAPFTATGRPRTLGPLAAEWLVTVTGAPGNNWLFAADWAVRTVPVGIEPFRLTSVARDISGQTTIRWPGEPGFDYQVWYSADLELWLDDLPGSSLPGVAAFGTLSFTDTNGSPARRFYRVSRSVAP